jgi:hypothetical protein
VKQDQNRREYQIKEIDEFLAILDEVETIQEVCVHIEDTTTRWAQSNFFVGSHGIQTSKGSHENDPLGEVNGGCKETISLDVGNPCITWLFFFFRQCKPLLRAFPAFIH